MNFKEYLEEQKKLRISTIKGHLQDLERFKKWCEIKNINYQAATYNQLLKYIQEATARGVSKSSINIHLSTVKKYYNYLVETEVRKDNPCIELRVKNNGKKVLQNLLTVEQLEYLYQQYKEKPEWEFRLKLSKSVHARNIVLLGLMIYQGLNTTDLKNLEISHINLSQASIYIPSGARSNSRILKLQAQQIVPLQEFIKGRKGKLIADNVQFIFEWFVTIIRRLNPKIQSLRQIRSNVIVNWLQQYNIRQVQYMAGHKHIGTTEQYKQQDLQDLQAQLNVFHPMK